MKKIMIGVASLCAVICAEAASVNWLTGTITKPGTLDTESGQYKFKSSTTGSNKVGTGANVYFWEVSPTEYALMLSAQDVYDTYWNHRADTEGDYKPAGSGATASSAKSFTTSGVEKGNSAYGVFLFEYASGDDTYWAAMKASGTIGGVSDAGDDTDVGSLIKGVSGNTSYGWTNVGWYKAEAVPEPTSGLLLLIGVAGLALRRRRV